MPVAPETIRGHLAVLSQRRSLNAALELFDSLGYQYADELPIPIRDWPAGVQRLVHRNADSLIYLAQHRDSRVVYAHLTTDHLSRAVERPIVEHTLHRIHPYALFVFANRDLTQWDFVNIKYVAEDSVRRRTIRRIHIGPDERLRTAAQRLALLAVPGPIQKKGWLNGQRDYLYHQFQAHYRTEPNGTDFYSDLLFLLFAALSNEGAVFPSLGDVPLLNGGLFEMDASAIAM